MRPIRSSRFRRSPSALCDGGVQLAGLRPGDQRSLARSEFFANVPHVLGDVADGAAFHHPAGKFERDLLLQLGVRRFAKRHEVLGPRFDDSVPVVCRGEVALSDRKFRQTCKGVRVEIDHLIGYLVQPFEKVRRERFVRAGDIGGVVICECRRSSAILATKSGKLDMAIT